MAKRKRASKIISKIEIQRPTPKYPLYRWPLKTKPTNLKFKPCTDAVLEHLKKRVVTGDSFGLDKGKPNYRKILETGLEYLLIKILQQMVVGGVISQPEVDRLTSYEMICDLFLECCGVEAKLQEQWDKDILEIPKPKKKKRGR